ncbi:putative intracellular septation protein A [Phaeobacter inhibens]|uniref:inner membrane-spanning protein YciB n=1 Tax=Phaeobacter inhibens TaxID=221822 RepID=UPI00274CB331|nr:inner membrane-spanning protein YciB [Phaeobacter inhibens]GLO69618.1 putative intracellular septation protein A [Phaeobacter inhibens]
MAGKPINPTLKMVLEFGPLVLFFVGYLRLRDELLMIGGQEYKGFIVVTAAFIPLMVLSSLALWRLTGHISKMQIGTLIIVVLFGGLSVWFNDERFFKMKPTILYVALGGALGVGLLKGQSYLKLMIEELMPLQDAGWMILTRRLCVFFFALALANELIWRTQSTDTWVYFKTFGLSLAMFAFFMTQARVFQAYALPDAEVDETE